MADFSPLHIATIALLAVSWILSMAATGVPEWLMARSGSAGAKVGLFRGCVWYYQSEHCSSYEQADWVKATAAMIILSMMANLAALVMTSVYTFISKIKKLMQIALFSALLAGVFGLTAVIMFGVKEGRPFNNLSVGWYLAGVCTILSFVASGFCGYLWNKVAYQQLP